jgi:hypothetical protein
MEYGAEWLIVVCEVCLKSGVLIGVLNEIACKVRNVDIRSDWKRIEIDLIREVR